ncbi:MAG: transporter [Bacteroidetes bacterium]|nr:transporter [Bacteroidota bacterium]MDA0873609.1 transporter [Bacteroidota bacterium]
MKHLATAVLLLACTLPAAAQDTIATDRPDFTESTSTVPQRSLQAEFGFTRATVGGDFVDTAGEGLIRYGLRSRFELRLGLPSRINVDGLDAGLGDMSVGFKWNAASFGNGSRLSVLGTLILPTGQEDFTSEEAEPSILVVGSIPLTDRIGLAGQTGLNFFKTADEWNAGFFATTVLGFSLMENVGAFAEVRMDKIENLDAQVVAHTGLTYLFSPDFQVDVHGGVGVTETAPDHFIGFGLAYRH